MKILHITDASSAGVLTAVTTLARAQSQHPEVEQVVLGYVPRPDSPSHADIALLTGNAVQVLRWHRGGRTALIGLSKNLWSTLKAEDFDVVHLHSSRSGFLGRGITALCGQGAHTVYSPHCFAFDRTDFGPTARTIYRGLERLGARVGNRLILVSESEAKVARAALPGVHTAVLSNAIDIVNLERIVEEHRVEKVTNKQSKPELVVVHVGRIQGQKRPEQFSAIAAAVNAALKVPVRFRWLGDGDRNKLSPQVEVTGWMRHEMLVGELARADAMLFTSAGEGMPMSVIEAQALGVPVVASDVTGLRDIVRDNITGRLASTSEALTQALVQVLTNPGVREEFGRAGATQMRRAFDAADLAERSLSAYRSLALGERKS